MHNLAPFSPKSPNALLPMCSAALARFAHANEVALRTLQSEALEILGDSTPVGFLGSKRIPAAGCSCVAFLNGLIDALERKDRYNVIPTHAVTQTDIYQCLVARSVPSNPQRNLENKIRKTFANIDFDVANFVFPAGWLPRRPQSQATSRFFFVAHFCEWLDYQSSNARGCCPAVHFWMCE